jgi:hypothetical protein
MRSGILLVIYSSALGMLCGFVYGVVLYVRSLL